MPDTSHPPNLTHHKRHSTKDGVWLQDGVLRASIGRLQGTFRHWRSVVSGHCMQWYEIWCSGDLASEIPSGRKWSRTVCTEWSLHRWCRIRSRSRLDGGGLLTWVTHGLSVASVSWKTVSLHGIHGHGLIAEEWTSRKSMDDRWASQDETLRSQGWFTKAVIPACKRYKQQNTPSMEYQFALMP